MSNPASPVTVAIIAAAGRGHRAGGTLPKQYAQLGSAAVLRHAVQAFCRHPAVGPVLCVIHPDDRVLYDAAVSDLDLEAPVHGGDTRQQSVLNGLKAAQRLGAARVLIHDAARPFVAASTISRVLDALEHSPGAIPALSVDDTIKRRHGAEVAETLDRSRLMRAQTPQGFQFDAIFNAHLGARSARLTDDASVLEHAGLSVILVTGDEDGFKITTAHDLARAQAMIKDRGGAMNTTRTETRVGTGFDVHKFGPGDHVVLCGVDVPHTAGLAGHSDADVGLHALTDAILGAIGAGDIGAHFPPGDPRWRGASSDKFIQHAHSLVKERGGRLIHLDLTLICEAPKIGPHRDAMRSSIAAILGLDSDRVSVKATTTEKLGFIGRREGIAAQAAATVELSVRKASGA